MAQIEITDTDVIVHVTGMDQFLALKHSVSIPREHIVSAYQDAEEAGKVFHGLRLPGTSIPGVMTAGSFLRSGEWSFWDVHDPAKAVIITTRHEHYAKIVVGVDDPAAAVEQLTALIPAS